MKNWRDPKQYLYTKSLCRKGWAWEFLRRNKVYGSAWEKFSSVVRELTDKYGPFQKNSDEWRTDQLFYIYDPPKISNESEKEWIHRVGHGSEETIFSWFPKQWGLYQMIDPKYTFMEAKENSFKIWSTNVETSSCRISFYSRGLPYGEQWDIGFNDPVQVVKIDLRENLEKQIKDIKYHLSLIQQEQIDKGLIDPPKRKNLKPKEWPYYLRILDAEDEGFTGSNSGDNEAIFLELNKTHNCESRTKFIDDRRRSAKSLRDGGYLHILKALASEGN